MSDMISLTAKGIHMPMQPHVEKMTTVKVLELKPSRGFKERSVPPTKMPLCGPEAALFRFGEEWRELHGAIFDEEAEGNGPSTTAKRPAEEDDDVYSDVDPHEFWGDARRRVRPRGSVTLADFQPEVLPEDEEYDLR
ncbi:MAG: hypothetical protein M1816_007913 [Peltula sp. TS41687]|nr:MAG: hypothetical protein M1816_007913 [Peltula sp. TS41687]